MIKPTRDLLEDMLRRHSPRQISETLQIKLQSVYALIYKYKIEYKRETLPPKSELEPLIKDFTMRQLGAKYGVSRQTILLWLRHHNIDCPHRSTHHYTEESKKQKAETFTAFRKTKEMDEKVRSGLKQFWSDPEKRKEYGKRMTEFQAQKPMISPEGETLFVHKDQVLEYLNNGFTYSNHSAVTLSHKETNEKRKVTFVTNQRPCKNANKRLKELLSQGYVIGGANSKSDPQ